MIILPLIKTGYSALGATARQAGGDQTIDMKRRHDRLRETDAIAPDGEQGSGNEVNAQQMHTPDGFFDHG